MTDALAGRSQVVVLRGEAGVGKSALLNHVSGHVDGWHVATAVGVESEMELAYSGLHQLCSPVLDQLDQLPAPQCNALATVFGLRMGPAPDGFLVGLATLTLFAEIAERQPLICIVDDAQWLDHASAQVIGFIARRLLAERVALVCAARTGSEDDVLAGLPELPIRGLGVSDARALLLDTVQGPLDAAVCDQIVAESHGNPLALLELPRTWRAADVAGGFGLPGAQPVAGKIERSYAERLHSLPADTRLLVLAAAAEPLGDPVLLLHAADTLGLELAAAGPAVDAGLLKVDARVEFAHPLIRSAAYRAASADDRHRVHHALAEATDAESDPDRRAWHRARATAGLGEDVAAELERSAGRAQARGGVAAAAAFLQRAVALTVDPARRAERALDAAQASLQGGAFDAAHGLLATAEAAPLDEFQRARAHLLRAHIAFSSGPDSSAPGLLLNAARNLEPFDLELARETYLIAWGAAAPAATGTGRGVLEEICRAALALPPPPGDPHALALLLHGLARLTIDGRAVATPTLQQAAKAVADIPVEDVLRWGWLTVGASTVVWDFEGWRAVSERQVKLVREAGALASLPIHLAQLAVAHAWMGDFTAATSFVEESASVAAASGSRFARHALLTIQVLQGRQSDARAGITSAMEHAGPDDLGAHPHWATAVLHNSLARYEEAASAAWQAAADSLEPWWSTWALPELVEAASRTGDAERAAEALDRLSEETQPCGNDIALGLETRCRALLSNGDAADHLYREAIERLSRTRLRPDLARAHLLYGEWLRREGRRVDARRELNDAYEMFSSMGMEGFAERARRELLATGAKVSRRTLETRDDLTPQEAQIARLARDGLSNPEIGTHLFLSPRTVEWHLRKVFGKLGINSRRQLRTALPEEIGLLTIV